MGYSRMGSHLRDRKSSWAWESLGNGRSHKGDYALIGKRLTEGLLNLGQKKMPASLRTASPQGAVLQELKAPASAPLSTEQHRKFLRQKELCFG